MLAHVYRQRMHMPFETMDSTWEIPDLSNTKWLANDYSRPIQAVKTAMGGIYLLYIT